MTRRRAPFTTVVLVVVAVGGAACNEEEIVLGSVPGTNPGGRSSGARCVTSSECGAGSFCDRSDCSKAAGTCEPFPVSCMDDEHPVCGCDGLTYFNDCLRRIAGVAGSEEEECGGEARSCDELESSRCPDGAVCAKLSGGPWEKEKSCHAPAKGRCWVLPATCPQAGGRSDRWDECEVDAPSAVRCVDTCSAIRSGKAFSRAMKCQ